MTKFVLIGAILELVLPFAVISWELVGNVVFKGSYGLLYYSYEDILGSKSGTVASDWFTSDGVYNIYFGDLWTLGVLVLILVIASFGLAVVEGKDKRVSEFLLLASALLLILLRFLVLGDQDLSFYQSSESILSNKYSEIPLAGIAGGIFAIISLVMTKSK